MGFAAFTYCPNWGRRKPINLYINMWFHTQFLHLWGMPQTLLWYVLKVCKTNFVLHCYFKNKKSTTCLTVAFACSVSVPFKSARDLSLWLWSTHNKVNERLMKEEKDMGTGDPSFPKAIWPPKALCPSCYRSSSRTSDGALQVDWNEDEVFTFLVNYYGKTLISSYKETYMESLQGRTQVGAALADDASSSHAARVPIGAALGVAAASCTFGAPACFWRTQQKNRKYSYRLHSLKKIWLDNFRLVGYHSLLCAYTEFKS